MIPNELIFFSSIEHQATVFAIHKESCFAFKVENKKLKRINIRKMGKGLLPAFVHLLQNQAKGRTLSLEKIIEIQGPKRRGKHKEELRTPKNIRIFFSQLKKGLVEKGFLINTNLELFDSNEIDGYSLVAMKVLKPEEIANLNLTFPLARDEQESIKTADEHLVPPQNENQQTSASPNYHNVPHLPSYYVQPKEFKSLRNKLLDGQSHLIGIHGMPGVGKTLLGIAVAQDEKIHDFFSDGVYYLRLREDSNPCNSQRIFVTIAGCERSPEFESIEDGINFLRPRFEHRKCLVVLDNVWDKKILSAFNILGEKGQLLFTTRLGHLFESPDEIHKITTPVPDDALKVLEKTTGVEPLPSSAKAIAQECGYLPLALTMIGSSLIQVKDEELWNYKLDCLQSADIMEIDSEVRDYPYQSFLPAMQVSFDELSQEAKDCFLSLAIFPDNETIPETVVGIYWSHSKKSTNWRVTLRELEQKSLLLRRGNGLMLHDLVRDYCRSKVKNEIPDIHAELVSSCYIEEIKNTNEIDIEGSDKWWLLFNSNPYFYHFIVYHLIESGKFLFLKTMLANYKWLYWRLLKTDIYQLLEDFRQAMEILAVNKSEGALWFENKVSTWKYIWKRLHWYDFLRTMSDNHDPKYDEVLSPLARVLSVSSHILARNKDQLPAQLHGRLDREGDFAYAANVNFKLDVMLHNQQRTPDFSISALQKIFKLILWWGKRRKKRINSSDPIKQFLLNTYEENYWFRPLTAYSLEFRTGPLEKTVPTPFASDISAIALDKFGKNALIATTNTLELWDIDSAKCRSSFPLTYKDLDVISISPNGKIGLLFNNSGETSLLDLKTGKILLRSIVSHPRVEIVALKFLDSRIYVLFRTGFFWVIDPKGTRTFGNYLNLNKASLIDMALKDGHLNALFLEEEHRIFFVDNSGEYLELETEPSKVTAISLGKTVKFACVGYSDGNIGIFSLEDGKRTLSKKGGSVAITVCSFGTPDIIYAGDKNGVVHVFPLGGAGYESSRKIADYEITHLAIDFDNAIACVNGFELISFNVQNQEHQYLATLPRRCIHIASGEDSITLVDAENNIMTLSTENLLHSKKIEPKNLFKTKGVMSITWGPHFRNIFAQSCDGTIRTWTLSGNRNNFSLLRNGDFSKTWLFEEILTPTSAHRFSAFSGIPTTGKNTFLENGHIFIDNPDNKFESRVIDTKTTLLPLLSLSLDREKALVVTKRGHLKLFSTRIHKRTSHVGHEREITQLVSVPYSDTVIAQALNDPLITGWNVKTGEYQRCFPHPVRLPWTSPSLLTVSPGGRYLFSCRDSRYLWDLSTLEKTQYRVPFTPSCCVFSSGGRRIIVGSSTNIIVFGLPKAIKVEPEIEVVKLLPAHDDDHFLACTKKGLYLFHIPTGVCKSIYSKISFLKGMPFQRIFEYFICANHEALYVYNLKEDTVMELETKSWEKITCIQAAWNTKTFFSGTKSGNIYSWDLTLGTRNKMRSWVHKKVIHLSVAPDEKVLFALTSQSLFAIDPVNGENLATYSGDFPFTCMIKSLDGQNLTIGDTVGRLHFLRLERGRWDVRKNRKFTK